MTEPTGSKRLVDVDSLAKALRTFAEDRDWAQFHSPKNLAMALTGEVGELVEIFQWMTEADSMIATKDPGRAKAIQDELADVLLYLVRLSDVLGVDLNLAAQAKLATNATKYPIEKARGRSNKSTDSSF